MAQVLNGFYHFVVDSQVEWGHPFHDHYHRPRPRPRHLCHHQCLLAAVSMTMVLLLL
jgi:hypothetical protein